jgi:hypothetical protein
MKYVENVYMSGNERTQGIYTYPNTTLKTGYHILSSDSFILNTELMNMDNDEKWVWPVMTYDYIDGEHPEYMDSKIAWQTLGDSACGRRENPFGPANVTMNNLQPLKDTFSEHSVPWEMLQDGYVLGTVGHLHDGATSMDIFHNKKVICSTVPVYAKSSSNTGGMGGASGGSGGHGHSRRQVMMGSTKDNADIAHISAQPPCIYDPPIAIKKGETMHLVANYDFNKYPG